MTNFGGSKNGFMFGSSLTLLLFQLVISVPLPMSQFPFTSQFYYINNQSLIRAYWTCSSVHSEAL